MGLGESIKKGHDEYRRFFAKLSKTTEKDAKGREVTFLDFKRKLYAHHAAEETVYFPKILKIPDLENLTFELMEEHEDMKTHFEALSTHGYEKGNWNHKLAPLYDIMHAHWLKEEENLIPFWPDYFSEDEWKEMGEKFDKVIEEFLNKNSSGSR